MNKILWNYYFVDNVSCLIHSRIFITLSDWGHYRILWPNTVLQKVKSLSLNLFMHKNRTQKQGHFQESICKEGANKSLLKTSCISLISEYLRKSYLFQKSRILCDRQLFLYSPRKSFKTYSNNSCFLWMWKSSQEFSL